MKTENPEFLDISGVFENLSAKREDIGKAGI